MNSYQLISKLRKVRSDTYLTVIEQALYYELVSFCNDKGWKDVFEVRSSVLCASLNISDKTLRKSRKMLVDSGLISFESCKDKRIGCYYSFTGALSNDMKSSVISSGLRTDESSDDNDTTPVISSGNGTDDITDDVASPKETSSGNDTVISSELRTDESSYDSNTTSVISSGRSTDDTEFTPIIDNIKTINEDIHAHMRETAPSSGKKSRKQKGDEKELVYPFTSTAFMTAWEKLRSTPKWKGKLNYALQISLNKLGEFEEEFAISQIERAIESNWTGVVFTGTKRDYQEWLNQKKNGNNRKFSSSKQEANDYALQQFITERERRQQGLVDEVERPF